MDIDISKYLDALQASQIANEISFDKVSQEEQKQEKERLFNQGANESEHRKPETEKDWVDEYESIIKRIERENKKEWKV